VSYHYSAPCIDCGQMVIMVKVKGTGLAAAMDPAVLDTPYWTMDTFGYLQKGGALVEHSCRPDIVRQFLASWLGDVNLQNALVMEAMTQKCPKCDAEPNEPCMNLIERHRFKRETPTKSPHPQRYPGGEAPNG